MNNITIWVMSCAKCMKAGVAAKSKKVLFRTNLSDLQQVAHH